MTTKRATRKAKRPAVKIETFYEATDRSSPEWFWEFALGRSDVFVSQAGLQNKRNSTSRRPGMGRTLWLAGANMTPTERITRTKEWMRLRQQERFILELSEEFSKHKQLTANESAMLEAGCLSIREVADLFTRNGLAINVKAEKIKP